MMLNSASLVVTATLLCSMVIDFSSQINILSRNNSDSKVDEDTNTNSDQFKVIQTSQKKSESSEVVTQNKGVSKENYTPAVNKSNYLSKNSMIGYSDVLAQIWKETDTEGENTPKSRSFLKKMVDYISRHTDINKNVTKIKDISESFYNETFGDVDVLAEMWNGSNTKGENITKLRSFLKKMADYISRHTDISKNETEPRYILESSYNETISDDDGLAEIWNGTDSTEGENIPKRKFYDSKMVDYNNTLIDINSNITEIKDVSKSSDSSNYESSSDDDILAELWNGTDIEEEYIPKHMFLYSKIDDHINNSSYHGLIEDNQLKARRSRTNVSEIQAPKPPSFENNESVQTTSSKYYRRKIYAEDILVMRRNRYRETTYKWDFLVPKTRTLSTKKRIPFKLRDFPNCIEEEPLIWICTKSCHNVFKSICYGYACPPRLSTLEHLKCVKHCSREIRARRQFTTRKITTTTTTTKKTVTKPKITTTTSTTTKPKPRCQGSVFKKVYCWVSG